MAEFPFVGRLCSWQMVDNVFPGHQFLAIFATILCPFLPTFVTFVHFYPTWTTFCPLLLAFFVNFNLLKEDGKSSREEKKECYQKWPKSNQELLNWPKKQPEAF